MASHPVVDLPMAMAPAIAPMQIIVSLLIKDPALRKRCEDLIAAGYRRLANLCGGEHSYEIHAENPPDDAAGLLDALFLAPGRSVIVVSDLMAPNRSAELVPTPWWQSLVERFPESRMGSVAIADWYPRRVPDVDRIVPLDVDEERLFNALARTVQTLEYKQIPQRRKYLNEVVRIRHVRTASELRDYYRLRHRIYSIMGYLDHEVESLTVGMEFDWCDLVSVHIGAFVESAGAPPRLIGTTRLITTQVPYLDAAGATAELSDEDRTGLLRRRMEEPYPFQMPFLQSHPDNQIVAVLQRECPDAFCEISRVIVDEDYRGLGLSKRLMAYTRTVAQWMGMRRMFLECLPTHRRLYEQFGFRAVPDRKQRVYNVNKTMELMELPVPQSRWSPRGAPTRDDMKNLRREAFLCLCAKDYCPESGTRYALFGREECPLGGAPLPSEEKHLLRQWAGMEDYYDV